MITTQQDPLINYLKQHEQEAPPKPGNELEEILLKADNTRHRQQRWSFLDFVRQKWLVPVMATACFIIFLAIMYPFNNTDTETKLLLTGDMILLEYYDPTEEYDDFGQEWFALAQITSDKKTPLNSNNDLVE